MNRRDALRTLAASALAGASAGGMAVMATPSAFAGSTASNLGNLIARHKAMDVMWADLAEAEDLRGTPEARAQERAAYQAEQQALEDLLRYRPTTLEESAERIAHLRATVWNGYVPEHWEMTLFLDSLAGLS